MASSALLAQIQAGTRLKKAQTNDRSAPQLDPSKKTPSGGGGGYAPSIAGMSDVMSFGNRSMSTGECFSYQYPNWELADVIVYSHGQSSPPRWCPTS